MLGLCGISVDQSLEAVVYLPLIPCQGHALWLGDAQFDWNHHWMG